jgi:hypothetical protein
MHTIILIVPTLVVAIVPALGVLVVVVVVALLLTILRIPAISSLAALLTIVVLVLVSWLLIASSSSILGELLPGLERMGSWLEGTCARAERGLLLRVVVQVHLLGLSRQVVVLRSRVIARGLMRGLVALDTRKTVDTGYIRCLDAWVDIVES